MEVQVHIHNSTWEDGPTQFLPTTHRLSLDPIFQTTLTSDGNGWGTRKYDFGNYAYYRNETSAGDVIFYYPKMLHRGSSRTTERPMIRLHAVPHSIGRKAVETAAAFFEPNLAAKPAAK